jgi:hypothetical protein
LVLKEEMEADFSRISKVDKLLNSIV